LVPIKPISVSSADTWMDWALGNRRVELGVAHRVQIMARLSDGLPLSGQELARDLGVSRAGVHKHMEILREARVSIKSIPGTGYRLEDSGDSLTPGPALIHVLDGFPPASHESQRICGLPYLYEPAMGSTNDFLKDRLDGVIPCGALAVTDYQLAGKGRLGRGWVSEAGKDLTFSLLLRPKIAPAAAHLLVLAASVAVTDVLQLLPGLDKRVGIKWPNDVFLDGGKVCGILSEASVDMDALHWMVLGLGLNVNADLAENIRQGVGGRLRPKATSLKGALGAQVPRGELLGLLVRHLIRRIQQVEDGGSKEILELVRRYDVLQGKSVVVRTGAGGRQILARGQVVGLGPEGELIVRESGGNVKSLIAGQVTLS